MFSLTELFLSAIQAAIVTVCIPSLFAVPSKSKRAGKEDLSNNADSDMRAISRKFIVVGANGSGKSTLIESATFIDNHRGNVVSLKEVPAADPSQISAADCQCADAAIVLCDVNVPGSIKAAAEWRRALSATVPTLLIGNKWDIVTDPHRAGADLELVASRAQFCSWLIADSTDQGFVKWAVDTLAKEAYFKRGQAVPVAECGPQKTPENSAKYNRRRRLRSSLSLELTSSGSIDLVGEV
eukprot:CAMPEP_0197540786 /NCGR_PEP_ID=MMETSP1318-20131121/66795_1 /TAXON_ID=552666 /ORGANISM="Partenskyella glossopodia, Strain RCC365" /LENGTH=239 /DNA_ID=CAMNT_0043099883 /DNA_START=983 /DNA_END=1702 /DNA_ORIENTATION=+